MSYSTDEELPALLSGDEAQVSDTESIGDEELPALEYNGSSSPPLHSPMVSNDEADLLAAPLVTQYPDDVLITGWGPPDRVSSSSIQLWCTIMRGYMQMLRDAQLSGVGAARDRKDQCRDK